MSVFALRSLGLRPTRTALVAVIAACGLAISAPARAATPSTEVPFLLNTGVPLQPFVENVGQDDPEVSFSARGPGGTVQVRGDDVRLALAATDQEGPATLVTALGGEAFLGMQPAPGAPHDAVANVYVGADPSSWQEGLPTWAQIDAGTPYPGVSLRLDATGRHLRWSFDATSVDSVAAIHMLYSNALSISTADGGALIVTVPAADGGTRTVRLEPPRAWQTGPDLALQPLAAAFVVAGEDVSIAVEGADPDLPVLLEVAMGYSRFRPARDALLTSDAIWAETNGAAPAGSERGGDIVITRFDAGGKNIERVTVLGGQNGSAPGGVGVSPNGHVWITGSTAAPDFPTAGPASSLAGESDAVLVELDGEGKLLRSRFLGGPGADRGDDLEVDASGRIWLAGRAGSGLVQGGAPLTFGARLPTGEKSEKVFVSRIDPRALSVEGTAVVPAAPWPGHDPYPCTFPGSGPPPWTVYIDAVGKPWVGVSAGSENVTSTTYTDSGPHDGCFMNTSGWGYEALCWKSQRPSVSGYVEGAAWSTPTGLVNSWNADDLNTAEANPAAFPNGDPPGGWEGPDNLAYSPEELAVAAALYMHRWGSPVYSNGEINGWSAAVGFHEVTLDADLADVCDFWGFTNDHSSPGFTYPIYEVANDCAFFEEPTVLSARMSTWDGGIYTDNTFYGSTSSWASTFVQPYVGDPPAEEAFMSAHIAEIAALQSHRTARLAPVETTLYTGSKPGKTSTATMAVAVRR